MRRPAKKNGSEVGNRIERKMRARFAPIERSSASAWGSLAAKPSANATVIGKNVTSATSRTLGVRPNPNQMIMSGAMRDDRERLRRDQHGHECAPQVRRGVDEHRERKSDRERQREAEERGAQRRQRVRPEVAAVVPGHREHAAGRGQHVVADAAEAGVELPGRDQDADDQERRQDRERAAACRGHQLWRGRYASVKYDE